MRPDWTAWGRRLANEGLWIIKQIARRLGLDFNYSDAAEVLMEINRTVLAYRGMTKERISRIGGLRWPCPDEKHPGTDILHKERFSTPDGKAGLANVENKDPAEATSPDSCGAFI